MSAKRVVIVGAGPAGLGTAYALRNKGFEVKLLEANPRVGGRLGGDYAEGFHIDEGADFFTPECDVVAKLADELDISTRTSKWGLAFNKAGKWYHTAPPESVLGVLKAIPTAWKIGMLRPSVMFKLIRFIRKHSDALHFGSRSRMVDLDGDKTAIELLADMKLPADTLLLLRGVLENITMARPEALGAAYGMCYANVLYFMSNTVRVPPKGMGQFSHALADLLRDSIHVSTPVDQIVIADGVATGVVAKGERIEADAVVCAVPATRVQKLVPALPDRMRDVLRKVTYSSGCRIVMGLDNRPLPPRWTGAVYLDDPGMPLLLDRSMNLPDSAPPGKSSLDVFVTQRQYEEIGHLDDEALTNEMLRRVHGTLPPGANVPIGNEGVVFKRAYRWPEAVCQTPPGMLTAVAEMRRAEKESPSVRNFFLAGDYMHTSCVNGAFTSGFQAADNVVAALS